MGYPQTRHAIKGRNRDPSQSRTFVTISQAFLPSRHDGSGFFPGVYDQSTCAWVGHLAAAGEALEAGKAGADAAADILTLTTTTHADGLSSHLLSRLGLLGSIGQWDIHLLDLGLVDFLGRHVDLGTFGL